ncbi:RICIN domain-containing protein [Actinokineospora fastidiosa]|uniref:Ricin B lectin domain-containing protein n=1 Tax=Actinokineospora fastidiosa TaxID=1816 RepID=A0A918GGV2_9PSEU|nr:RICIN domain-containing protein [Actinokineospora fastidiosa]GGS34709.1 hypothetical protein GCM10010171_31490 [Actinokineospora fastidiosa]
MPPDRPDDAAASGVSNTVSGAVEGAVVQVGSAKEIHVVARSGGGRWFATAMAAIVLAALAVVAAWDRDDHPTAPTAGETTSLPTATGPTSAAPTSATTTSAETTSPETTSPDVRPAGQPAEAPRYLPLTNLATGHCLTADVEAVIVARCEGRTTELWTWRGGYGPDTYRIVNQSTGTCLALAAPDIVHLPCGQSDRKQLWKRTALHENDHNRHWLIASAATEDCLVVLVGKPRPAAPPPTGLALRGCDITDVHQTFATPDA